MVKGIHTENIMSERNQPSITIGKVEQCQVVSQLDSKELALALRRAELLQNNNHTR